MINFILYENNKHWQEDYKKSINYLFIDRKEKYKIYVVSNYNKAIKEKIRSLDGKNIYILNMDMSPSGLEIAKKIRNKGDWISPMILTTSDEEQSFGLTINILALDIIPKDINLQKRLMETILIALQIHSRFKSFNFLYNNELYQIPYNDILYFEKDLNHNYTSIITKANTYKIKESIKKIEERLKNTSCFFKTHQSCIVNLKNIKKVNFSDHTIYFKNKETNLLSRNQKKELKRRLEQGIYL